ncbi:hypothetical protein Droror1_Dr00013384 [Drosera rotundifolia]
MAIQFSPMSSSPRGIIPHRHRDLILNNGYGAARIKLSRFPLASTKLLSLRIKFSLRDQVFEDRSEGIVCYRDDRGEIVCEGMDEGPRFDQQLSLAACHHTRDDEITDVLQETWLQILYGSHANCNGILAKSSRDGFNRL